MTVFLQFVIIENVEKVPCVQRATLLTFLDAPGLPQSVTDDADNTWTLQSEKRTSDAPLEATWYTTAVHMPKHITLNYPGCTDGFDVPRDMPRLP